MLIAAMGIWGTIGLFRKSIPLSSGLIAFSRGVIGAAFLSLLAKGRGGAVFQGVGRTKALWLSLSGAAALYAAVVLLNKRTGGVDAYQKSVIQLAASAAVLVPYLLLTEDFSAVTISAGTAAMLLVVGILHTGVAYALYFGSMDGLKTQTIAIFSYIDPIVALLLSALVLSEKMSAAGIAGSVLILSSAVFSELRGRR